MKFDDSVQQAKEFIEKNDNVHLVSHADADGICATSILTKTLKTLEKTFTTAFIEQVSTVALENIKEQTTNPVIFVDLGSSHLEQIETFPQEVLILDHHQVTAETTKIIVNPFLADLDGTRYCCAASLVWKVCSQLTDVNKLAPVALIAAQADSQEPFEGINEEILEVAKKSGAVVTERGARLYGKQTKPLPKLLAYSYDLKIPELKKNLREAFLFLQDLGIPTEVDGRKRLWNDLSEDEKETLNKELIDRSPNPEIEVTHYTITDAEGPMKDTREAATLLNACGRLGKPELAVKLLLGLDHRFAQAVQKEYREEVHRAHTWAMRSRPIEYKSLFIFNAGNRIKPMLAGTLCSILVRGREVPRGIAVVCLARNQDKTTKVSGRTSGEQNLAEIMQECATAVGGEGGGHAVAAGAVIPSDKEEEFIEQLKISIE